MRNYPGIIVRQHHTDQKQMGLQKEQFAEWKRRHLRCHFSRLWLKIGGRIPWNVTAIYETFKISCLMGRHHMTGGSQNHLTDQLSRLEQWSNITLSLRKTHRDYINLAQKYCQVYSSVTLAEFGKETYKSQTLWRNGADGCIWTPRQKA